MSHLYNIFHIYDVDGGFGDAVMKKELVGLVEATEEEIEEFLKLWDKPRIYDSPYNDLYEHHVVAEEVKVKELSEIEPYDPTTRDWPDLPRENYSFQIWNGELWITKEVEED